MHTFDHIHQCENPQLLSCNLKKTKVWPSYWWSLCSKVIWQMVLVYCFRNFTFINHIMELYVLCLHQTPFTVAILT